MKDSWLAVGLAWAGVCAGCTGPLVRADEEHDAVVDLEPAGETAPCEVDAEVPPEVYVRRVKGLLTGGAPTDAELQQVQADPAALAGLVEAWIQTEAYEDKLAAFFRKTLQLGGSHLNVSRQMHNGENANSGGQIPDAIFDNIDESFVRTALRIATTGEPFTEIVQTRTWEMTTAMMAFLAAVEDPPEADGYLYYHDPVTVDGVRFDANTPLSVQGEHKVFHVQMNDGADCAQPFHFLDNPSAQNEFTRRTRDFRALMDDPVGDGFCDVRAGRAQASDYTDWRSVTFVAPGTVALAHYSDLAALRGLDVLPVEVPRVGFFTAPSFLATWETNDDNSHRVITNQTLIVALGTQFDSEDVTLPLGDEGLADEHAAPDTACYGCHKNLDPMRNYFKNALVTPYYAMQRDPDHESERATFSFQGGEGGTGDDETLVDFGRHLAQHPRFAPSWVNKLCLYANSARCDESDPEFDRVLQAFVASNYDFRTLVIELFSSPLVTRARCGSGYPRTFPAESIARREQVCAALAERLGVPDVCTNSRSNADDLAGSLPEDAWPRGKETPEQPTEPSLVYAATLDATCAAVAANVVDRTDTPLDSGDLPAALQFLVTDVMALPASDPLHAPVLARLEQLVADAEAMGVTSARTRLESAFVVACNSPFVASVDL